MVIAEVRKKKNLTQKELCERAGISQALLSKYESGQIVPSQEKIAQLAKALEVDPDEINYDDQEDDVLKNEHLIFEMGLRIRMVRKTKNWSQEKLAEEIGISPHYMYEIERGRKTTTVPILVALSRKLGVSLDYLILGKREDTRAVMTDDLDVLLDGLTIAEREDLTQILRVLLPKLRG